MTQSWTCSPQMSCPLPPTLTITASDWLLLRWCSNHPQWTFLIWQEADDILEAVTQHVQSGRCMFWHFHACVSCSSTFSSIKHGPLLEVCCCFFFIPMLSSHLRGNVHTIFYLLSKQSHGGRRDTLSLCYTFGFPVAACPPCSQSTCFACDLLADSPGVSAAWSHPQCAQPHAA